MKGADLRMDNVNIKLDEAAKIETYLTENSADPGVYNEWLESVESAPLKQKIKLSALLSRPHIGIMAMAKSDAQLNTFIQKFSSENIEFAEIKMKYEGYILKEEEVVKKMIRLEDFRLQESLDYFQMTSLSNVVAIIHSYSILEVRHVCKIEEDPFIRFNVLYRYKGVDCDHPPLLYGPYVIFAGLDGIWYRVLYDGFTKMLFPLKQTSKWVNVK